ncbi:hypothetical protein F4775DRAFT_207929 [Biscogniauxia sp. FL1348]|nr:hypothetical protein F4775DRAFT_207929 [Biscogniauxia sp. FL1348]
MILRSTNTTRLKKGSPVDSSNHGVGCERRGYNLLHLMCYTWRASSVVGLTLDRRVTLHYHEISSAVKRDLPGSRRMIGLPGVRCRPCKRLHACPLGAVASTLFLLGSGSLDRLWCLRYFMLLGMLCHAMPCYLPYLGTYFAHLQLHIHCMQSAQRSRNRLMRGTCLDRGLLTSMGKGRDFEMS